MGLALWSFSRAAAYQTSPHLLEQLEQVVQQGNVVVAHDRLDAAIKQFPRDPGLYNLLGIVEAQQGNRASAETDFKKALELAPQSTNVLLNLGRLYLDSAPQQPDAPSKALNTFQKVLRYEPNNPEALYQSAALLSAVGSYRTSLSHLNLLPREAQDRTQVLAVRCADLVGLGQTGTAASVADRLLASSELAESDVIAILPSVEKHDEVLARRLLEGLMKRHLAGREALVRLGWYYERQQELPQARETLEQAEQAGPPAVDILSKLARVAYQQQDRDGALGYLAHARDLDPRDASIHFFFGVVCIELNLPLEARKSLEEAVRLDPENAYYNYALGSVALHSRDPGQAVPYFAKFIKSKPQDPRGRFGRGVAYFYAADYEAAAEDLRAVANKSETASGAHYFLGRIAKLQDNLPEAEMQFKQALVADPHFADALAELGQLHIRLNRYDEAEEELNRAFALEPDNLRVNSDLLVLYLRTSDRRAAEQQSRVEEIKKKHVEDEKLLWRTIEVRPY